MSKTRQLRELAVLTEMNFAARSAEVQKLTRRYAELTRHYNALSQRSRDATVAAGNDIGLLLTGTDVLYQVWLGRQMSKVNAERARILVEKQKRLEGLKIAFGKKEVAAALAKNGLEIRHPVERDS